jgi:hypothetical protein
MGQDWEKNWEYIRFINKVTLSLGLLSPTIPSFQCYLQSKENLLNVNTKRWNSTFNAQGTKLIIIVIGVGVVKIYVTSVEALREKERQDETQFSTKIDGFLSFSHKDMNLNLIINNFFIILKSIMV